MKIRRVLGVDPGIANTGLGVVESNGAKYRLLDSVLVRTAAAEDEAVRCLKIYEAVDTLLTEFDVEAVAIEKVYHNKNISSSIKTGKAIGAVLVAAATHDKQVFQLTPQEIKASSGFGGTANKKEVIQSASRLFGTKITSHHLADACFCGIAGLLQVRSKR